MVALLKAAGSAGFFGYMFAGTDVGWIADNWFWRGVIVAMCVCSVLTMAFSALKLTHRAESAIR